MTSRRFALDDLAATQALAGALARALVAVATPPFVIDLRGPLGAGKTAFVRALALALGVPPGTRVVSPTFTLQRSYPLEAGGFGWLHHLDAYRLAGPDDLEAIGFEERMEEPALICVEWGDRVALALGEDRLLLELAPRAGGAASPAAAADPADAPRELSAVATGPRAAALLAAWHQAVAR